MSKAHWLALASLSGVGGATARKLIEQFGDVEAVFDATDAELLEVPRVTETIVEGLRSLNPDKYDQEIYGLAEEEIDLYRGIFIRTRTVIPMVRVQHVDTEDGPLYRYYKLAAVTISTAATQHVIPALSHEVADELRAKISQFAMVVEDDV